MSSFNDIAKKILEKLLRKEYIGARHTAYEHAYRGFPRHLAGKARKITDELIRNNLIIRKQTGYGLQISLNPLKMKEIENIIRDP
jgi:hypothetical protein